MLRALLLTGCFAFAANAQLSTDPVKAQQQQQQQQVQQQKDGAQAAAAAGAGAAIVAQQLEHPPEDLLSFPAPGPRTRQTLGYASPWTLLILAAVIVVLAALIKKFDPKGRKRIRRITILYMLYLTSFAISLVLGWVHAEGWARRTWFLADLMEVLVIIDFVAILLFDLIFLLLKIEVASIVHDIALGAAYIFAVLNILHRSGVQLSGLVATSAVVTVVLGLSLQATLGNVLGGIALQLDDSIHVGDWLQLPSGVQGKIVAVRWRHTLVETRNWDTIVVPNSALLAENITILGLRSDQPVQHRMWVYFNVDFRYSPEEVINTVEDALQSAPIPNVAAVPPPNCICYDFARQGADSFGYYAVRYWLTELAADDPTSSSVRVRIYAALKRKSIPLAVPGQTVWVSMDDKQHQQGKAEREMAHRVSVLSQLEMFTGLNDDDRGKLAAGMRPAPFGRGEVITRQASVAHWLYVLTRGECEVRVRGEAGVEKLVARLEAPNVFGEMGVMTGERRTASVVAATEVECYRLDKDIFQGVLRQRPELVDSISQVMARRRVELLSVREDLSAEEKRQRIHDEHTHLIKSIRDFFGLNEKQH
ncbi:MAG TPA: mechanosensitive ion channel family protein [Myxococcales bacterium]|jgi:small-conductance mechanosensitive channel|nr:mechanosensitive ion channel family protein [Myxococcales bacterium]